MRKDCKELKPGSADEATAGEAEKSRDAVQESSACCREAVERARREGGGEERVKAMTSKKEQEGRRLS